MARIKKLGLQLEGILNKTSAIPLIPKNEWKRVPITELLPGPYSLQREMNENTLLPLVQAIQREGVIEPLIVSPAGDRYVIVSGERRWRAAERAGLFEIPVIVHEMHDEAMLAFSLIEKIQQQQFNPIEEAEAYLLLIERLAMTHAEVATLVKKSRAQISNALRLLNLSGVVRQALIDRTIEMAHARCLASLRPEAQQQWMKRIISEGLSVRKTELFIRAEKEEKIDFSLPTGIQTQLEQLRKQGLVLQVFQEAEGYRLQSDAMSAEHLLLLLTQLGKYFH